MDRCAQPRQRTPVAEPPRWPVRPRPPNRGLMRFTATACMPHQGDMGDEEIPHPEPPVHSESTPLYGKVNYVVLLASRHEWVVELTCHRIANCEMVAVGAWPGAGGTDHQTGDVAILLVDLGEP